MSPYIGLINSWFDYLSSFLFLRKKNAPIDSNDNADAATLIDYFYIENAAGTFKINDNNFACIPSTNWLTNIRNMSGVTALEYKNNYAAGQAGTNNASGINFMLSAMPATSTVAIEGNTFANMSGTIINLGAPAAAIPVSIKGNVYTDNVEFRCRNRGSVVITYADNAYYKAPEASDANPAPSDYTRLAVLTVNPAAEEDATHFKTIAAALTAAKANETIVIAAGTYSEALTIDKSVTLKGPNAGKLGTATDRADEAILAGTITVSADNVKIDGFKLTAQVTFPASATVANFEYVNNLLADFAGEGFVNAVSSTLVNVNISGNYTPDCKSVRWIRLGTVENMKCNDNKIVGSNLYDTFRVDTCLFGYCEFMGNHVESTLQSVFMIMGVGKMTLVVKDNYFKDILATCVDTRGMVAAHAGDVVEFVIHNTFDHAGYDWRCLRPRNASFGDNKLDVQVHYNSFINGCATEVEGVKTYANNPAGADVIYNMNYNFFQEVKAAELTNANFAGVASSWAEGFDSAEALEAAYAKVK